MQQVLEYDLSEEQVQSFIEGLDAVYEQSEQTKEYKKIMGLPAMKEAGKVGDYYYTIDTMIFQWKQQYKHGMEQE